MSRLLLYSSVFCLSFTANLILIALIAYVIHTPTQEQYRRISDPGPAFPKAHSDYVFSETRVCPVHRGYLLKDTVPIRYGLPKYPEGYTNAQYKYFPNSNTYYGGGCVFQDKSFQEVYYCKECREAEARWLSEHESSRYTDY